VTKVLSLLSTLLILGACSGVQVKRIQPLAETADAPYKNVLVVSLFDSFDVRRYLEKEIVRELEGRGVRAVASTSLMDTKTPVTRETFLAMLDAEGSDALLLTQLVDLNTEAKLKDARPKSTYNVWPTYYYNVYNVQLTEYVAPKTMELNHTIVLASQVYSVGTKEPVWGIESNTKLSVDFNHRGDTSIMATEAKSIVNYLSRDGLLAQ